MPHRLCLACLTSDPCPHPPPPPLTLPQRSVSENSLVAMDFSGRTGRVIDNPVEAQSAALEEGQTWRVREEEEEEEVPPLPGCLYKNLISFFLSMVQKRSQRMNVLGSPSPMHPSSLSAGTTTLRPRLFRSFGSFHAVRPDSVSLSVIHRTQVWFHGRIMREEAHKMIIQQGQVDG